MAIIGAVSGATLFSFGYLESEIVNGGQLNNRVKFY
jgi:hypothetical protein